MNKPEHFFSLSYRKISGVLWASAPALPPPPAHPRNAMTPYSLSLLVKLPGVSREVRQLKPLRGALYGQ